MKTSRYNEISRNNKGFTLIELIITLGILMIITTGTVALASRITSADTRKAAKIVDATMDKLRLENMTKKNKRYLHIYKYDNSVYINITSIDTSPLSPTEQSKGQKIGGDMAIYYKKSSEIEALLTSGASIIVSFERSSGAFSSDYETIRFEYGGKSSTIYCTKLTGRHHVE